jgi:hypothetical protein
MSDSHRDFAINQRGAELQTDGSYLNEYGVITWYNDAGSVHKEDGPAIMGGPAPAIMRGQHNGTRWFLNGTSYSFNEFITLTPITDEAKMMLRLQYA